MKVYAPKLTVTNTDETAPEISRLNYGGQEFPIKAETAPKLTVTNTDETAPEIARLNYGGQELPIKANTIEAGIPIIPVTGGSGGILKKVTGNISTEDWTTITGMTVNDAAKYFTIEDFSKPDLETGELFRLKLGKKGDTSIAAQAVAVLTYNEYGVYTNKGILYFGGNSGGIYVVQGLISDNDHRLLILRLR